MSAETGTSSLHFEHTAKTVPPRTSTARWSTTISPEGLCTTTFSWHVGHLRSVVELEVDNHDLAVTELAEPAHGLDDVA